MYACKAEVILIIGAKSIFYAYEKAIQHIKPKNDDIVIFCHDDIEIRTPPEVFVEKLKSSFTNRTAFVGVAGTTHLSQDAVWWNWNIHSQGKHRGRVFHVAKKGDMLFNHNIYATEYGPEGNVVVLDGLFLAARGEFLNSFNFTKPTYFEGEWDFYDIHYTHTAYMMGFINRAIIIDIVHHSSGELVGRDSWHQNQQAFIRTASLPVELKES